MEWLEEAEEKYKHNPIFHKLVDSLFESLKNKIIDSHDLELAVKLANFKDDIETMRAYEPYRGKE